MQQTIHLIQMFAKNAISQATVAVSSERLGHISRYYKKNIAANSLDLPKQTDNKI